MNKLNEMWAALAVYQPQADAEGHGETWATMCREKTSGAARDADTAADAAGDAAWSAAWSAAVAARAYAEADAAWSASVEAADAAWSASVEAAWSASAAYAAAVADADRWAQSAIDGINKLKE